MKRSPISLVILSGLISCNALATDTPTQIDNSYQHELDLALGTYSDDFGDGVWNLGYRYYLSPVSVENGPYALNGTLAQASNIGVQYAQMQVIDDIDVYHIDATYVFDTKWFVGGMYAKTDNNRQYTNLEEDQDSYQLSLGYYFNDTSEVSIYYANTNASDSKIEELSIGHVHESSFDSQTDTYGVKVRSFIPMQSFAGIELAGFWQYSQKDAHHAYRYYNDNTGEAGNSGYDSSIENHLVHLAADFYINKSWSVGGEYSWQKFDSKTIIYHSQKSSPSLYSDDASDSLYAINTAYWWQFSNTFAANASVAKYFDDQGDSPDGVFFRLAVNARF